MSAARAWRRLLLIGALATLAAAQAGPGTFPVPAHIWPFTHPLAPPTYPFLQPLISALPLGPGVTPPPGESLSASTYVAPISLGALGQGYQVSIACMSENCPAAIFARVHGAYRRVYYSWGAGLQVVPSGGPVPYLIGYDHLSCCDNPVTRYRWNGTGFVADACERVRTNLPGGGTAITPHACAPGEPPKRFSLPPPVAAGQLPPGPVSAREVALLRPALEKQLASLSPAARAAAIAGARAQRLDQRTFAVQTANCDGLGNCPIYLFLTAPDGGVTVALRGSGTALARGSQPGFAMPIQPALYMTRSLIGGRGAPGRREIVHYRQEPSAQSDMRVIGPNVFSHACSQANGLVNGAAACMSWYAASCEIVRGAALTPVYCANAQPIPPARIRPAVSMTGVSAPVQDASGAVWALSYAALLRWEGNRWQATPPPRPGFAPLAGDANSIWRAPDGGVDVVWCPSLLLNAPYTAARATGGLLSWQRGNQTKILARLAQCPTVLPRAARLPLVVIPAEPGAPSAVAEIAPDGSLHRVFQVPRGLNPQALPQSARLLPVETFQRFPLANVTYPVLQGMLVADQGRYQYHPISGLPQGMLATLVRWDKSHLLASITGVGPFLIDTATLQAQPLPTPETADFRRVAGVFSDGHSRYVVVGTPSVPLSQGGHLRQRADDLWRWRSGRWRLLVRGLDPPGYDPSPWPHLRRGGGLWIGVHDGLWFLPGGSRQANAGPRAGQKFVNWRQGLPLAGADSLFPLPGGKLLAADASAAAAVLSPRDLLQPYAIPASLTALPPGQTLQPGPGGTLWILRQGALQAWNGARWHAYPLPLDINLAAITGIAPDTAGWVWLLPGCSMFPTLALDSHSGVWQRLGNYLFALSRLGRRVRFVTPRFRMQPVYGPHRQITVWGLCNGVSYFDGVRWRIWNMGTFPPPSAYPFFDTRGRLALNTATRQTMEWTGETWAPMAYQPRPAEAGPPPPLAAPPPPSCPTPWPSSLVTDKLGRAWWTADGNLYEGTTAACRVVLSADQAQPFRDGRRVVRALVDSAGNVFLETDQGAIQYIEIAAGGGSKVP